jgi:multisubunit Na+/H+ antiporter MnhG subunit
VSGRAILSDVLLSGAVLIVLASSLGILLMRDVYQKLHYVTPVALVAPFVVGLAILAQSGLTEDTGEMALAMVFIVIGAPFLSHATIRAARVREKGDWRSGPARDGGAVKERP